MDILNSAWLLNMLKKSGKTPQQCLLGMFDILQDWVNAPHVREALTASQSHPQTTHTLETFLIRQARSLNAAMPEALARQIYFIALTALNEEVSNPGCSSLLHGRTAAEALLKAQQQKNRYVSGPVAYGVAASLFASVAIGGLLFSLQAPMPGITPPIQIAAAGTRPLPAPPSQIASPSQTAELIASIEQMRKGTCHFPEALQLPDSEQAVYIENVVGGRITVNAQEQALVRKLMSKVRCNYTPMLMANSVS